MTACRELSYNDWGMDLQRASAADRVPLAGSMEITFRCNLRCVHCYIADYSGDGEMETAEIDRILGEIADAGCLWLLLTGGEVLSRRDFRDIYLRAKRLGFLITVFTNGTLVDARVADLWAEYAPFGVEITLYGLSDATYLKTTGFPGRFAAVRRGIDLLLERGVKLTLKAVAMDALTAEIPAMESFAAALGVPFRYDPIIHARLDGSLVPTAARPSPRTVEALDADPARKEEWLRFYRQFVEGAQRTTSLLTCGAGLHSFHVDPKGTLLACEALPLDGFDLRRGRFLAGWHGIVGAIRRRQVSPANVCVDCSLRGMCDRCPATAMLETGDPNGWIPYYCEVTHRRGALLEEARGDAAKARAYRAHADKVAGGWSPEGAILPRAGAGTTPACASGGCAARGCGAAAERPASPLQIGLPPGRPDGVKEAR